MSCDVVGPSGAIVMAAESWLRVLHERQDVVHLMGP